MARPCEREAERPYWQSRRNAVFVIRAKAGPQRIWRQNAVLQRRHCGPSSWMSTPNSPPRRKIRRDGWTPERQLRFLQILATTRSIARAAACVGMSRESAYRLRSRLKGELFALAWDSAYAARRAGERHGQRSHRARPERAILRGRASM